MPGHRKSSAMTYFLEGTAIAATLGTLLLIPNIARYASDIKKSVETSEAADPSAMNEDYYCDLSIPGSDISFHVVRGSDNLKYLHTAFSGEESELGAIFMDYRCDAQTSPHTIIYGHDAQDLDGNLLMFGKLRNYLDEEYIAGHTELSLYKDGEEKKYRLFAVKVTDTKDAAYHLDFDGNDCFAQFADRMGAPDGTREILTLSTCLGGENNMRLLIQGAVVDDR